MGAMIIEVIINLIIGFVKLSELGSNIIILKPDHPLQSPARQGGTTGLNLDFIFDCFDFYFIFRTYFVPVIHSRQYQ